MSDSQLVRFMISWACGLCVLSASCSSDPIETQEAPWDVEETETIENEREVDMDACRDDFVTGPVWEQIDDKGAALQESEWIAILGTTKTSLIDEDPLQVDYSLHMDDIETLLSSLEIEIIENKYEGFWLVVAGSPSHIMKAIGTSCLLTSFDLTGFHCDCAPEQCTQARECRLNSSAVTISADNKAAFDALQHMRSVSLYYEPVISCIEDFKVTGEAATYTHYDFRQVEWLMGERFCRGNIILAL